ARGPLARCRAAEAGAAERRVAAFAAARPSLPLVDLSAAITVRPPADDDFAVLVEHGLVVAEDVHRVGNPLELDDLRGDEPVAVIAVDAEDSLDGTAEQLGDVPTRCSRGLHRRHPLCATCGLAARGARTVALRALLFSLTRRSIAVGLG